LLPVAVVTLASPMLAAFCATLLGVGLQRFAYSPLLPAMIEAGWLSPSAGGVLGAINLAGYLAGALTAGEIGRALGTRRALRIAMATLAVLFALCAFHPATPAGPLGWFGPWRFLAGTAGGVLMVLTGPALQLAVPPGWRGFAAGAMFAGVGGGIIAGSVLVPVMLPSGIAAAWLALALIAVVLTALVWRLFPAVPPPPRLSAPASRATDAAAWRLVGVYTLAAIAATPTMLWWPDYIARGLGQGTVAGAHFWLIYGVAACGGPTVCGRFGDWLGAGRALSIVLGLQILGLALPLLVVSAPALLAASLLAGGTAIGGSALVLTRTRDLAGEAAPRVWRIGTACFGGAQALAGFGLARLYDLTASHMPLLGVGAAAALAAFLLSRR